MRILHVAECYDAGVGRAIDSYAQALPDDEHHLLYIGEVPRSPELFATTARMGDGTVRRIRDVTARIAAVSPDVVHAHSSWAGVYVRSLPRPVATVYQPHCFVFADPGTPAILRLGYGAAEALLARRSDAIATLSAQEDALARRLRPRGGVARVANRPSIPPGTSPAAGQRDPGGPITVAALGRIAAQKDPATFAAVAAHVRALRPGVEFLWIGDGDPGLRGTLESAGVRVTGWLEKVPTREALGRADLYLHTASYEGFPIAVLDAAALGLPILARDIPALAGTGLQLASGRRDLAERLLRAVDDPGIREGLRRRSARLLGEMNPTRQAETLRSLYASALEHRARRRKSPRPAESRPTESRPAESRPAERAS